MSADSYRIISPTESRGVDLTLPQIVEMCPGVARETVKSRLARGQRVLASLRSPAATRQQIARRSRW